MNKYIKLIEEFLSTYEVEGVCSFWVDEELDEFGTPWVYIVFDKDWLEETKPEFIVKRMKSGLKNEIHKFLGIEVHIGVTSKKCDKNSFVNENVSPELRRRINFDILQSVLEEIIYYEINACEYKQVYEYVGDVCDRLKDIIVQNTEADISSRKLSAKDNDELYYFLVFKFEKFLQKYHKEQCGNITENKSIIDRKLWNQYKGRNNKIIVTESQFNRLFEEKQTKKEFFQELIDEKLQYIKDSCENISSESFPNDVGFTSCDNVDTIESIKIDELQMVTGTRTDLYGKQYDSTPSIFIKLKINYSSAKGYENFDEIIYDIEYILRKSTGGLPIVLGYDSQNLRTNREW